MTVISYAQNFEDVMLWRALKDVDHGFYIDVGANDPIKDSVTKMFYDAGWRGINIEPETQWYDKLVKDRKRDINLKVAAGNKNGEAELYVLPDTGLSTCNKEVAEMHENNDGYSSHLKIVEMRTLTDICQQYHLSPIHFLKIDVETAEKSVLEGVNFDIIRPWIVVVEATLPNSQKPDFENWESILFNNKYEFMYFDGLNRFYVAVEKGDLINHFDRPPNVFDQISLSGMASSTWCNLIKSQKKVQIERIIESKRTAKDEALRLNEALQKSNRSAKDEALRLNEALQKSNRSAKDEVLRLNEALQKSKRIAKDEALRLDDALKKSNRVAIELNERNNFLERELSILQDKIFDLNKNSHHWYTVADNLKKQLDFVYSSKLWRTKALVIEFWHASRRILLIPITLILSFSKLLKIFFTWFIVRLINFILARPKFSMRIKKLLLMFPGLARKLKPYRQLASPLLDGAINTSATAVESHNDIVNMNDCSFSEENSLQNEGVCSDQIDIKQIEALTPQTKLIYRQLKLMMGSSLRGSH